MANYIYYSKNNPVNKDLESKYWRSFVRYWIETNKLEDTIPDNYFESNNDIDEGNQYVCSVIQ